MQSLLPVTGSAAVNAQFSVDRYARHTKDFFGLPLGDIEGFPDRFLFYEMLVGWRNMEITSGVTQASRIAF